MSATCPPRSSFAMRASWRAMWPSASMTCRRVIASESSADLSLTAAPSVSTTIAALCSAGTIRRNARKPGPAHGHRFWTMGRSTSHPDVHSRPPLRIGVHSPGAPCL
jgi:hypothetical protein